MDLKVPHKRFVHVEYPGIVQNEEKMLKTLGGEKHVSEVVAKEGKRLELRLRPDDPFCKPACADRQESTALLLRVRRRKKKKPEQNTNSLQMDTSQIPRAEDEYEYDTKIMGYSDVTYSFSSLMDFQYLPMTNQEDNTYKPIVDDLVLSKITPRSWMRKEAPLFLTPPIFSRIDQPLEYCYRDGPKHRPGYEDPMKGQPPHLIGIARQRRPHYTIFVNFSDESVPCEPMEGANDKVNSKRVDKGQLERVKQLFEERPVWSKNGIRSQSGLQLAQDQLKHILPFVGYFWVNGPWRALWTRFGYDPRRDPKSKVYQLVDYRVRQRIGDEGLKIKSKRSSYVYTLPTQVTRRNQPSVATIKQDTFSQDWNKEQESVSAKEQESLYRFWPGCRPPYRQMFYQLCDVDLDEVREIVHQNDGQESVCTERNGWCIDDYQEKCRAILVRYVNEMLNSTGHSKLQQHSLKHSKRKSRRKVESEDTKFYPDSQDEEDELENTIAEDDDLDDEDDDEEEQNEMATELLDLMGAEVGSDEEEEEDGEGEESA